MSLFEGNRDRVRWDGRSLTDAWYRLYVVDIERHESNQFGVSRTVNMVNNKFISVEDEVFTIDITFIKADYNNDSDEWDRWYLDEVAGILFEHKEPKLLEIGSKIYYGLFINGSIKKINKRGYFTVTFQSVKPTAYGSLIEYSYYTANEDDYIKLENSGLYDTYADITIKCIEDGELELTNYSCCGYTLKVNMIKDQVIKIIGETQEILGDGDAEFDTEALKLERGVNRIRVTSTGIFKFKYNWQPEFPLI